MPKEKEDRKKNPEANGIAGFTLGIVSITTFLFYTPFGILLSLVGLSLCLRQQRRQKTRAARTGIILNLIGLVVNIIVLIISAFVLAPYMKSLTGA